MNEDSNQQEPVRRDTLEHTDQGESMRQLWWTVGATLVALAAIAYFTL